MDTRRIARVGLCLLAVAPHATDGACQKQDGAGVVRERVCEVDTRGVQVTEDGQRVTDIVTARCNVPPVEHRIDAWLEYKTSVWGEGRMPRFPEWSTVIPDAEGVSVRVWLPCREGYYRAVWRTTGRGPAMADHPRGIPFDELDGDMGSTHVDAAECAG
jgi:hypothetical protein